MKFKYTARNKSGEPQGGFVTGPNREAALSILESNDLFVLSLDNVEKGKLAPQIFGFFERVRLKDVMIFTRQFATLLSAQIALADALQNLQQQTKNNILREAIFEIASDVAAGLSLSQSLERHPTIFSEFYINMVRAAEVSGRLEATMNYLADYLDNEIGLRTKVKNALIYPTILIFLFIVVSGIMVTLVFPQLRPIFDESGVQLPLFSRIMIGLGEFMANWWWAVVSLAVFIAIFIIDYFQTPEGRSVFDEYIVRIPILGDLFKKLYITRFADATSVLIKGGIPITHAIEVAAHTIGNAVYQQILLESTEAIRRGETMSQSLSRYDYYFPPLVSQMIGVGESTGQLDNLLMKIAKFYTREVESMTANLVELIQPIVIVIIGIFVGLLFASILLPIYKLSSVI